MSPMSLYSYCLSVLQYVHYIIIIFVIMGKSEKIYIRMHGVCKTWNCQPVSFSDFTLNYYTSLIILFVLYSILG